MKNKPRLKAYSRRLRREPTPSEKLLWPRLRDRRFADFKFRRQHVIEPYIVDFVCNSAMLIVELDGESHVCSEKRDRNRQLFLEAQGFTVLRFWDSQIFGGGLDAALEMIWVACQPKAPSPRVPFFCEHQQKNCDAHVGPLPAGERGTARRSAARSSGAPA